MCSKFTLIFAFLGLNLLGQTKADFLRQNNYNLRDSNFDFPQEKFKLIGFGAYHGSAKTEEVELKLLENLMVKGKIKYYLPETDYATALYFEEYLKSGDTKLLKKLITHYGTRVPQDRTVETYNKWIKLKKLNDQLPDSKKIEVIGIDKIADYTFSAQYIYNTLKGENCPEDLLQNLGKVVNNDTLDFITYTNNPSKKILKKWVEFYTENTSRYGKYIKDNFAFDHIIQNIKKTWDDSSYREATIFENYLALSPVYGFDKYAQFVRFGFFHLEKSREGKEANPSFFARLIENKVYSDAEIISVIGFLTDSRVLWDQQYDNKGHYIGYTTKGGFGIGDYWKEYFRGIARLKKSKISDLTLFNLRGVNSPYQQPTPDLIEVKMVFNKSNHQAVQGMSTLDFMDYAVLITDSRASVPIEEMQ